MDDGTRSPLRLLAPAAVVASALAVLIIVVGSGGSEDAGDRGAERAASGRRAESPPRRTREPSRRPSAYTVQQGDTLAEISDRVGLSVEEILELNPELDPQFLTFGQKIKLRE